MQQQTAGAGRRWAGAGQGGRSPGAVCTSTCWKDAGDTSSIPMDFWSLSRTAPTHPMTKYPMALYHSKLLLGIAKHLLQNREGGEIWMGCSSLHSRLGWTFPTSNVFNVSPQQLTGWAAVIVHELLIFNQANSFELKFSFIAWSCGFTTEGSRGCRAETLDAHTPPPAQKPTHQKRHFYPQSYSRHQTGLIQGSPPFLPGASAI